MYRHWRRCSGYSTIAALTDTDTGQRATSTGHVGDVAQWGLGKFMQPQETGMADAGNYPDMDDKEPIKPYQDARDEQDKNPEDAREATKTSSQSKTRSASATAFG
ncbi:hypothetical protein [Hydrogenophaga sp. IBVHS2]|uniref:hypothetical protein n=1 Tax=Hydrogenophaga sp. IBVHS2 TaxID=1985170 RepID=UPI00117A6131|nr:hypothetical protein [Hydrogenophaga sp. IBVHS2]